MLRRKQGIGRNARESESDKILRRSSVYREFKKEKEEIAVFKSRSHDPGLCGDVLWLSS